MILTAIFLPLLAAPLLGLFGSPRQGAVANAVLSGIVFVLTLGAFAAPGSGLVHADELGLVFGGVTGFTGLTTAIANIFYLREAEPRFSLRRWRVYHAMCQVVLGSTLLGLYADNIGLLWAAVETATIAATLAVSMPRTASALEAAWKYFILGGVGIGLALFGTMLVYLAAQPALGPGFSAMSFTALAAHAPGMDGSLLTLAFVFILFGYGTKAALVPLHGWLPDAYAEGPAPLTTSLSGPMLNVALIAILRFRHLLRRISPPAARPCRRGRSCSRWGWPRCSSPPSRSPAGAMRGASSASPPSSIPASRRLPSGSAALRRSSAGCCTCCCTRSSNQHFCRCSSARRRCAGPQHPGITAFRICAG